MSRRAGLRLLAAGAVIAWFCLFTHWDTTEESMIRALLAEKTGEGWTVGLLYQFPEASADASEAEASIRLCTGRGSQLSAAITSAEASLPQCADWHLCEYLLIEPDSLRQSLSACEELYLTQPYGRLASRVFGTDFSVETLEDRSQESDTFAENLLQCLKDSATAAPRLYEQSRGFLLPVIELKKESAVCQPEALVVTEEHLEKLPPQQTEMALLLQGKSWTKTGEYPFETADGTLCLRWAFCGVEKTGENFIIRVSALSRKNRSVKAEQELEDLCEDTLRRCWALGFDLSGLGAMQAQRDGTLTLTTKNACPNIQADVQIIN